MSQNDFTIANQGFPSFRSDLNSALQALATNSSGTSEPTTTFAYQWWYDTTNNILKMRNADDDAWIDIAEFDQTNDEWLITKKTGVNASSVVPAGTTAQRDPSPAAGYIRFNTTTTQFEGYNGSGWVQLDDLVDFSDVDDDLVPDADDTYDIGTSSAGFADAWFKGTIHVDNFAPSAGGTAFSELGIAKASASVDQTAGSLTDGNNISSITDLGVGSFRADFTNPLAISGAARTMTGSVGIFTDSGFYNAVWTTTGTGLQHYANGVFTDTDEISTACYGDLA